MKKFFLTSAPERNRRYLSNGLILAIAVFYLLHLTNGHDWGGDFSMYIHHAVNLVSGIPYSQTGYIYNPDTAYYGPPAYPPVFPLMLAPFVFFFGINLLVLKIPGIFCFVLFLFFLNNRVVGDELPEACRILLTGLTGLFPAFFLQSESILSDLPFLLLTFIALFRLDQAFSSNRSIRDWKSDLLTGIFVYLSYGTRTVGITLLPIVFLLYLLRRKNNGRTFLIIAGTASTLILIQRILIPGTGSYLDQVSLSFTEFFGRMNILLSEYITLSMKLVPIENMIVQKIIFLMAFLVILLGFYIRVKRDRSVFEIFFAVYMATLLAWSSIQGFRLLLPIIPLVFLYAIEAMIFLLKWKKLDAIRNGVYIAAILAAAAGYFVVYRHIFPRPESAIDRVTTQELFNYVKTETAPDEVFVFFKPRVLALFTGRSALALAVPGINVDPIERMRQFGVDRIIVRKGHNDEAQSEQIELIEEHPENFSLTYSSIEFSVYKFK
jgi:hypothetical protein